VNVTLVILAGLVAAFVLYWIPVRGWYRRSEARRVPPARAMSGDADLVAPDYESTLTITIGARPADVWPRLLEMGRPAATRQHPAAGAEPVPGDVMRFRYAPAFPVQSIDPGRTLVLGDGPGLLQWRWQFELYAVDVGRTRLLSRIRIRSGRSPFSRLVALALRPIAFVITRKMLFDVQRRAERGKADHMGPLRAAI
jgi:hypothetical protein